jgi:methanogenic corrinoid protein MtbC1
VANEYHQVGAKMVADAFEWKGWDGYYLGANTPEKEMLRFLEYHQPDLVGLSLSLYFNLPSLKKALTGIRTHFPSLPVLVGGQAFRWGGSEIITEFENTYLLDDIIHLQEFINTFRDNE